MKCGTRSEQSSGAHYLKYVATCAHAEQALRRIGSKTPDGRLCAPVGSSTTGNLLTHLRACRLCRAPRLSSWAFGSATSGT
eukprot:36223-Chlamydomonas_euryale.AAC.9